MSGWSGFMPHLHTALPGADTGFNPSYTSSLMPRINCFKGSSAPSRQCIPVLWALRGMGSEKATGVAAMAGGLLESLLTPSFWVIAIIVFALFFAASHLRNRFLRALLFWLPAGTISLLAVATTAFVGYLFLQARHSWLMHVCVYTLRMRTFFAVLLVATTLLAQSVAGLKWTPPSGWKAEEGERPMRAATY